MFIGIDTGGTFTDFVVVDHDGLRVHKVLSTPDAPEQAILQGIRDMELDVGQYRLIHGSTVATNAVLEGKGVRTVYIANRGLGDILTIGRQNRRELYNLQSAPQPPPVATELCLETGGRLSSDGEVIDPLSENDLARLIEQISALQPQAVAINLLFSYINDEAERRIESAMPDDIFVSRSSRVLPEYREYERGMATFLNAYVGPLVQGYLQRLEAGVAPAPVAVMQSSGETANASQAGELAVHLLLSGPAGGLMGARYIGQQAGCDKLLTFDMGGTSTDVALVEGRPHLTNESTLGDYPVAVPMVDMHTIGAGGGSIARVDEGGLLQVGPESAGAKPGPACYGKGGVEPTVTDANVVLGRLPASSALGGSLRLDVEAARTAVKSVADKLSVSIEEAAEGIVALANEHMARALRVISVNRGEDPRDYVLASFGGAGGLHVCALAEAMGMEKALVPIHAGVLSALGMLVTPPGRQLSRTLSVLLESIGMQQLESVFTELADAGIEALSKEGIERGMLIIERSLDLCYEGQSFTLSIPWQGMDETILAFHAEHEHRYGHRLDELVGLVNVRVAVRAPDPRLDLESLKVVKYSEPEQAALYGIDESVSVWRRGDLSSGQVVMGPALVVEAVATTYIAPGWKAEVDRVGNLLLMKI